MIFDIDTDMVVNAILESLESIAVQTNEEQLNKVIDAVDDALPGVIQVLAQGMAEHWKAEARSEGVWGSKYAKAVKYKVTGTEAEIYLDEEMIDPESKKPYLMFAKMMEEGVKPWSIRDALMKSEKVKVSSKGIKYIVVPFPVATPRNKKQGKMQSKFGRREMSRAMHNIVKSGGRLKSGTIQAGPREVDVSGLTRFNSRKFHEQYGIFRVVTQDSKGWKHPGRGPQPVYPSVLQEVNKQIDQLLRDFCQDVVREYSQ